MTEEEIRQRNEERRAKLDAVSRRNMEKRAAFIARMIEKYGREVLAEIEEEERQAAAEQYGMKRSRTMGDETPCPASCLFGMNSNIFLFSTVWFIWNSHFKLATCQ